MRGVIGPEKHDLHHYLVWGIFRTLETCHPPKPPFLENLRSRSVLAVPPIIAGDDVY
jgi:hypothetical protein